MTVEALEEVVDVTDEQTFYGAEVSVDLGLEEPAAVTYAEQVVGLDGTARAVQVSLLTRF